MKKFIALLLASCMVLAGCGQQESPAVSDAAVVEEQTTGDTSTESTDEAVVSDAAIEETEDVSTEDITALDPNTSDLNLITDHDATDPAADNTAEYFPEITNLVDLEQAINNILPSKFDFKNYNYSIEHRRFDFLESGNDEDITFRNFTNAGEYLTNEFIDERNLANERDSYGYYRQSGKYYRGDVFTHVSVDADIEDINNQIGTLIYLFKTIDDPGNGLTVLIIEDVPSQEVPV